MKTSTFFIAAVLALLLVQLVFSTTAVAKVEELVYSDKPFLELVRKYTVDGGERVDYESWKNSPEDLAALDRQVALIARVSPVSHPQLFPTKAAQRSYWINTYNTLVLRGVLEYWPLESVRDVKISITSRVVPGKGFFYDRKVVVGGEKTNLYKLEKEVLRNQKDPRLHFALNCASESCPVLRPWEWTDEQLDEAAREFINNQENVSIEGEELYLSSIFKWYKKDFPKDIHAYLQLYSEPGLYEQLQAAKDKKYRTRYRIYDWSLNTLADEENSSGANH
ncbi:MAG: DUF547 domain-containing protein [Proteobacteria bacterium]|nr:DUF547 domain-containing protein [Pseudomonadota bacterium]